MVLDEHLDASQLSIYAEMTSVKHNMSMLLMGEHPKNAANQKLPLLFHTFPKKKKKNVLIANHCILFTFYTMSNRF